MRKASRHHHFFHDSSCPSKLLGTQTRVCLCFSQALKWGGDKRLSSSEPSHLTLLRTLLLWPSGQLPTGALGRRSDSSCPVGTVTSSFFSFSRHVFSPGPKFLLHGYVVHRCGSCGGCCTGTAPGQHRHVSLQAQKGGTGIFGRHRPENTGER